MSLRAIRDQILQQWQPPFALLTADEQESLREQLADVRANHLAERWKPLTTSAGQIVEALLGKLVASSPARDQLVESAGIGRLIDVARRHQLFNTGALGHAGEAALGSMRLLRNWSAHYQFWRQRPTELRATQALALLVCTSEILFPQPPILFAPEAEYRRVATKARILLESDEESFQSPDEAELYDLSRAVCNRSLAAIARFCKVLRRRKLPLEPLGVVIEEEFVSILRRVGTVSPMTIYELVKGVKRCGRRDHARVLNVALPVDHTSITRLLTTVSPASAATYFASCARADRQLLRAQLGWVTAKTDVARAFWKNVQTRDTSARLTFEVIRYMPVTAKATIMRVAPRAWLLSKLSEEQPFAALRACTTVCTDYFMTIDPLLESIATQIVATVRELLATAPIEQLDASVSHLQACGMLNQGIGEEISRNLLGRMASEFVSLATRSSLTNALWHLYIWADKLTPDVADIAVTLASSDDKPDLHTVCMRGLAELAAPERSIPPTHDSAWIPELTVTHDIDAWRAQLAVLGASAWGVKVDAIPVWLRERAAATVLKAEPRRAQELAARAAAIIDA